MENRNITTKIIVCSYDELNEKEKKLIDAAKEATNRSYSPYSRFQVGAAALLSGGTVITGSNQENAAYPSGICAERTTLFYAILCEYIMLYKNSDKSQYSYIFNYYL